MADVKGKTTIFFSNSYYFLKMLFRLFTIKMLYFNSSSVISGHSIGGCYFSVSRPAVSKECFCTLVFIRPDFVTFLPFSGFGSSGVFLDFNESNHWEANAILAVFLVTEDSVKRFMTGDYIETDINHDQKIAIVKYLQERHPKIIRIRVKIFSK